MVPVGPPRPMTPALHPSGVVQVVPSKLDVASSVAVMLPPAFAPLSAMFVAGTAAQAAVAFCASQLLSMWHLGSSSTRFDCVPVVVRTPFGEAVVSQYQRSRHGPVEQSSPPGSRPVMLSHFVEARRGAA